MLVIVHNDVAVSFAVVLAQMLLGEPFDVIGLFGGVGHGFVLLVRVLRQVPLHQVLVHVELVHGYRFGKRILNIYIYLAYLSP